MPLASKLLYFYLADLASVLKTVWSIIGLSLSVRTPYIMNKFLYIGNSFRQKPGPLQGVEEAMFGIIFF